MRLGTDSSSVVYTISGVPILVYGILHLVSDPTGPDHLNKPSIVSSIIQIQLGLILLLFPKIIKLFKGSGCNPE